MKALKLLVPVTRVIDPNVKVRVKSDGSGIQSEGVKQSLNPFDEVALEKAVRMREAGTAGKVTVVACGAPVVQDVLRTALAMGADEAVLVEMSMPPDALESARAFAALARELEVDVVLLGKQSTDDDLGSVGPMLAGLLDWPQAVAASALDLKDAGLVVQVEADEGLQTLELDLPAVVTADLRLAEPRNISLPSIMKAKKKPIGIRRIDELGGARGQASEVVRYREPDARAPGRMLGSADELVQTLVRLKFLPGAP